MRPVIGMSLTSQLHHGALSAWCADRFPGVEGLIDQVHAAARRRLPVRPIGEVNSDHWTQIDGAFRQRLAFFASRESPYAALLGAARAGLPSASMIDTMVGLWPTQRDMPPTYREQASQLRPIPTGWHNLAPSACLRPWEIPAGEPGSADHVVEVFTSWLVRYLVQHVPPGSVAASRAAEQNLARACWVLAGYESTYRGSGRLPAELAIEHQHLRGGRDKSEEHEGALAGRLLDAAPRAVVGELVALVDRLSSSGVLEILRTLADNPDPGQPLGYAPPTVASQWSGGDLVVGDTLIGIKTIVNAQDRAQIARWLFQILTAWLDTPHRYRIRNVGLLLARHGVLLSWPLKVFAKILVDHRDRVSSVRREFLEYAYALRDAEGAVPLTVGGDHGS